MLQHRSKICALDDEPSSFDSFIERRLDQLKHDLIRECDRISTDRELFLKKRLGDTLKENEELRAKMQHTLQRATSHASHPVQDEKSFQQTSSEVANLIPSDGSDAKTERFTMWQEYNESVSLEAQVTRSQSMKVQESIWHRFDEKNSANSRCVLHPNSRAVICWEVFGILALAYDIVTIPLQVFDMLTGVVFGMISWTIMFYWTTDIFLRLLVVGQIRDDGIILERKDFMNMYLKSSFTFDFLVVAPDWFSKLLGASAMRNVAILRLVRLVRFLRLLRMTKMKHIFRHLEDAVDSELFCVGVSVGNNILAILAICHYCACFWFWVGTIKSHGHPSWVEENLADATAIDQYFTSLHWAIAQFTPGASKIKPCNTLEIIASICILLIGLIFLAVFITALGQARSRFQAITSKIDRDNFLLRRYFRQQGVSYDLRARAMKYVERCVEPTLVRVQRKDVALLPLLSRSLLIEIQEERYFCTLIAHPLLRNFKDRSASFTLHLFDKGIVEFPLARGDLIFEAGNVSHEMIFVSQGIIAYLQLEAAELVHLELGQWCCEAVLWVAWTHCGTAYASSESHLIYIDSAKLRAAVPVYNVRGYVSRCARAFVKDLNALLDQGEVVDDLTRITDDASSFYVEAMQGTSEYTVTDESHSEKGFCLKIEI